MLSARKHAQLNIIWRSFLFNNHKNANLVELFMKQYEMIVLRPIQDPKANIIKIDYAHRNQKIKKKSQFTEVLTR